MVEIDFRNSKPIYEQIVDQTKEKVMRGLLCPGDSIPSVRKLASMLNINPNTVSKAYRELEREKIIVTERGRGTFISDKKKIFFDEEKLEVLRNRLKTILVELGYMGIGKNDVMSEIEKIYSNLNRE